MDDTTAETSGVPPCASPLLFRFSGNDPRVDETPTGSTVRSVTCG
ncbi:hypothetical protein HMPREF1549_02888 [Actinomyces johnsonii F0510]|uniref:Uncharacterized protein n=1 Tax=Actinomyces johnsonii F0510 TaxID=1227262 RepID=U1PZS7_9ACTO|nr:hypothetical protein HMPREF1549_02888 [Actinomyces johnsonii F0510]